MQYKNHNEIFSDQKNTMLCKMVPLSCLCVWPWWWWL